MGATTSRRSTQTRLIVRQRLTYSTGQGLVWRLVEPINFAMEHKMLKGLKARAERRAATEPDVDSTTRYDVTDTARIH